MVIRPDGEVLREFVSLIDPERDIGPTGLHGITAGDVILAPRFGEVAPMLIEALNGCVAVAGHNVRFDRSFLACEFERLGHAIPECPALCTMQMAGGGSLSTCCKDYRVEFDGNAHSALDDARATARLLAKLLVDAPRKVSEISMWIPIGWPSLPRTSVKPLTRQESRRRQVDRASLEKMLQTVSQQRLERPELARPVAGLLSREDLVHRQVCFTGECQCQYRGRAITRPMAMELAARGGMVAVEYVTKKLDFLVAADPMTQSGKAKKARQYGVRIIHEPVFWAALGLDVG